MARIRQHLRIQGLINWITRVGRREMAAGMHSGLLHKQMWALPSSTMDLHLIRNSENVRQHIQSLMSVNKSKLKNDGICIWLCLKSMSEKYNWKIYIWQVYMQAHAHKSTKSMSESVLKKNMQSDLQTFQTNCFYTNNPWPQLSDPFWYFSRNWIYWTDNNRIWTKDKPFRRRNT